MSFTARRNGNRFELAGRVHTLADSLERLPDWINFYASQERRLREKHKDEIVDTIYAPRLKAIQSLAEIVRNSTRGDAE